MFSENLSIPNGHIIATYIWIDQNEIHFKYRTLNFEPKTCEDIPLWVQYDSSYNLSDEIFLRPCAMYRDPFHGGNNILVLCECFDSNDKAMNENWRAGCREVFYREEIVKHEIWLEIEQKFEQISQNILFEFYRCCLHAGIKIASASCDYFQIGPCESFHVGDDLWASRFLMLQIAQRLNFSVKYLSCTVNISTKGMREHGGLKLIERAVDKLGGSLFRIPQRVKSKGSGYFNYNPPTPTSTDPYKIVDTIIQKMF